MRKKKKKRNGRALMAVMGFVKEDITENAIDCMRKLFKDYKQHKDEVRKYIVSALEYLQNESLTHREIDDKMVIKAKKEMNKIAKEIWKG
jgi:hypothetical protein